MAAGNYALAMKNYVYDPESAAAAGLTPGTSYRGAAAARAGYIDLATNASPSNATVPLRDVLVQRNKPPDKLRQALADVSYESRMLLFCHVQRSYRPAYTAWFVHARNLMDFVEGKAHEADEVSAQLYFYRRERDWHTARRKTKPPARYHAYRAAANKLAAHLTFDRIKYRRRRFPPDRGITEYLLAQLALFAGMLDVSSRKRFIRGLLEE